MAPRVPVRFDPSNDATVVGANIIQADIETSKGVIHVIDAVIMPGM